MIDGKKACENAIMNAAEEMCLAAITAPKACGIDHMHTLTLTGADKDAVAAEMERLGEEMGAGFFIRDAGNVRTALVLVLMGIEETQRGLGPVCGYCHYNDCGDCKTNNGVCVYDPIDVGIALGSAAATAADCRMDSRILFSAGRAAQQLGLMGENVKLIYGLPLAVTGKSPFFDRKPKK
jgi:uncharacterized ferredoxin-like protein